MLLSFGVYVKILLECSIKGTTQQQMIADIVGTIDPENKYKNSDHKHAASKLATCKTNFPSSGSSVKSLTKVIDLAKTVETAELKDKFDVVVKHLREDSKQVAVTVLQNVIKSKETLDYIQNGNTQLFAKCMGTAAMHVCKARTVDLRAFLAGIFLFIVLTNDTNTLHPEDLDLINDDFINKFLRGNIEFKDLEGNNTVIPNEKETKVSENIVGTTKIINLLNASEDIKTPVKPDNLSDLHSDIEVGSTQKYSVTTDKKICSPVCRDEYWSEFELFPERFYVRNLYFIVFNYNNDYYVMLDTNRFDFMNVKEAYELPLCSVPSICEQFNPRDFASDLEKTAGDFYRILEAALSETHEEAENKGRKSLQERLDDAEHVLLKTFNFNILNPKSLYNYVEYRISFTERNSDGKLRSECVCNREFLCVVVNSLKGNFSFDPECQHRYTFLPMSVLGKLKQREFITKTDVNKLYNDFYDKDAYWNSLNKNSVYMDSTDAIYQFAGFNIPYYVHDALLRNFQLMQREAKKIAPSDLLIQKEGILFHITIHNFYIHDKIETYCQIHDIFLKCMLAENIKYYQINNYEVVGVLNGNDFTNLLENMYAELAKLMHAKLIKLHICCTALYGEYTFGRIAGLNSNSPGFIGETYETLLRMTKQTLAKIESNGNIFTGILFGMKKGNIALPEDRSFIFKPKNWTIIMPIPWGHDSDDIEMDFIVGDETDDGKDFFKKQNEHIMSAYGMKR